MPAGKAQDGQWRRHPIRHDFTRVRKLCRGPEDLPCEISRSKLIRLTCTLLPLFHSLVCRLYFGKDEYLNNEIDWWFETQSARGENQNRPGSSYGSGGPVGGGGRPSSTGSGPNASSTTAYHGQSEGSNNVLSPHGMDTSEHDNGAYGNVYPTVVGVGHNGAVSESY